MAAILLLGDDEQDRPALDRAIIGVEKWLGFYRPAAAATATAPRADVKRGRPSNDVLMKVISELQRVFHRFYRAEKAVPASKASSLPAWQQAEADFVATALEFAEIPHLDDIRRRLTAPGAALLHQGDRLKQIEKVAAKVRLDRSHARQDK